MSHFFAQLGLNADEKMSMGMGMGVGSGNGGGMDTNHLGVGLGLGVGVGVSNHGVYVGRGEEGGSQTQTEEEVLGNGSSVLGLGRVGTTVVPGSYGPGAASHSPPPLLLVGHPGSGESEGAMGGGMGYYGYNGYGEMGQGAGYGEMGQGAGYVAPLPMASYTRG